MEQKILEILELLYLSRFVDVKMSHLVKQNKGGTFFLSTAGHELVGIVCANELIKGKDFSLPYYRDRAFVLSLGAKLEDLVAAFLAREISHHSAGRMMPEHFSDKGLKIPCQSSVVGSQFLQATGVAWGIKNRKSDEIVYVSSGDGATSQGDFHEALNFSSIHKLPIVFVIQDNRIAISTKSSEQTAGGSIAKIAKGYENLSVFEVDGTDYFALEKVTKEAYKKARENFGPSVIVAKVPRINSHTNSDDQLKYRSEKEIQDDRENDPILKLEKYVLEKKFTTKENLEALKKKIKEKIDKTVQSAEKIKFQKKEDATKNLFKEFRVEKSSNQKRGEKIVLMDSLNQALFEEMKRDEGVVVFGEDVSDEKGGVFGITRGLSKEFGKNRCFNTPLAESTIIGIAIGMSFDGFHKPVAEIQFADYAWTGMNQLVNELASVYYRSNGEWNCPVTIRMPYGGYIQGGPYHSQSIEVVLLHSCGIKVVIPSNALDAKRLLKTAIRDPNPVVFLEHKSLYRQRHFAAREESCDDELLEFGKANIVREGSGLTIITYGLMVSFANDVAKELEKENISIEIIDLRTLNPLDMETIEKSIKKTSKALICHEDIEFMGFAAEIMAQISEKFFQYLDAPLKRVCAKNTPIPYAIDLENEILPQKEDIKKAVLELISY